MLFRSLIRLHTLATTTIVEERWLTQRALRANPDNPVIKEKLRLITKCMATLHSDNITKLIQDKEQNAADTCLTNTEEDIRHEIKSMHDLGELSKFYMHLVGMSLDLVRSRTWV